MSNLPRPGAPERRNVWRNAAIGLLLCPLILLALYRLVARPTPRETLPTPTERRLLERSQRVARALAGEGATIQRSEEPNPRLYAVACIGADGQQVAQMVWERSAERLATLYVQTPLEPPEAVVPDREAWAREQSVFWLRRLEVLRPDQRPERIAAKEHSPQHWSFQVFFGAATATITLHRRTGQPIVVTVAPPKMSRN